MKKFALLCNEAKMALAGARNTEERGDHLLEVLGIIIIALVILVLFRNVLVPKFQNATTQTGKVMDGLWGTDGQIAAPGAGS